MFKSMWVVKILANVVYHDLCSTASSQTHLMSLVNSPQENLHLKYIKLEISYFFCNTISQNVTFLYRLQTPTTFHSTINHVKRIHNKHTRCMEHFYIAFLYLQEMLLLCSFLATDRLLSQQTKLRSSYLKAKQPTGVRMSKNNDRIFTFRGTIPSNNCYTISPCPPWLLAPLLFCSPRKLSLFFSFQRGPLPAWVFRGLKKS